MTGWGDRGKSDFFISKKPTIKESGALYISFGLMTFLLIKDGYVYWLWNGAVCIDF